MRVSSYLCILYVNQEIYSIVLPTEIFIFFFFSEGDYQLLEFLNGTAASMSPELGSFFLFLSLFI